MTKKLEQLKQVARELDRKDDALRAAKKKYERAGKSYETTTKKFDTTARSLSSKERQKFLSWNSEYYANLKKKKPKKSSKK